MSFINVTDNDRTISITATAGQTIFNADWPALLNSQVIVEKTPDGGSPATLVENIDYTLSGIGGESGFTVTLTSGATLNDVLRIFSNTEISRLTYFAQAGKFAASAINDDLSLLIMICQELQRDINGVIAGSITPGSITNALIGNNEIQNAKLAQMAANTIKGNDSGSPANPSDMTVAELAQLMQASTFDMRAGVSQDVLVTPANIANSLAWVTLADAANITLDFQAGFNRTVTLAGNRTLDNAINVQPGTSRFIEVVQDATGSRTLSFGSNYAFVGQVAPTLSTAANAKDLLQLYARSASEVWVFYVGDIG